MKTTIDIPDPLYKWAKIQAVQRGATLKEFVVQALEQKRDALDGAAAAAPPAWKQSFGALRHLRKETKRIQSEIDETFGQIEPEDRL